MEELPVPLNEPPALTPKVSPLDKSIEVTWNEVPGAKLYNVYWAESKPCAKPEETDKNSAPIIKDTSATIKDGIDNGKTYGVQVEAVNESGGTIVISDTVSCIPAVLHTNIGKAELEKLIETDIPASPEIYHRIKFDRDITINRLSTLFDKTVYLAGPAEGECVISKDTETDGAENSADAIFRIGSDSKLELEKNIILDVTGFPVAAVYLLGGSFVMHDDSALRGATRYGVLVDSGIFTMNGGVIKVNSTDDDGGGVWVSGSSLFVKTGGTVYGNNAGTAGADKANSKGYAVYVDINGTTGKKRGDTAGPDVNLDSGTADNWDK